MMSAFDEELTTRLDALRECGLYRELRRINSPQLPHTQVDGRTLLNFSSNDYLGLANDPRLREAAIKGIERYGAGSGASRLICGSLAPHHELEQAMASFKGAEAALAFSSGYASALGTICALLDQRDTIIIDKLVHACIVDAARLCGAKLRVFAHNDLDNRARSFIFSTAPVPAAAAAATAAVHLIQSDDGQVRRNQLWARVDQVKNGLIAAGSGLAPVRSAIIPLVMGGEARALEAAAA